MTFAPSRLVEQLDDRTRKAREIVQRSNDSLSFGEQSFVERYISMKLNLGYWCSFGEFSDLGFICHANEARRVEDKHTISNVPFSDSHFSRRGMENEQPAMLSLNVQVMQEDKATVSIASTIRFQRFDNHSFGRGKPVYEFRPLVFSTNELGGAIDDGKIDFVRTGHAVAISEGGGEDVETASDCIDVSARFHIERERQRRFFDHYQRIIGGIRAAIFEDYIQITFDKGIEPFFEGWEIGYGPVNGCLSVEEIIAHGTPQYSLERF